METYYVNRRGKMKIAALALACACIAGCSKHVPATSEASVKHLPTLEETKEAQKIYAHTHDCRVTDRVDSYADWDYETNAPSLHPAFNHYECENPKIRLNIDE